jgi:hypothetical protein
LYQQLRADLWGNVGRIHVPGREQRDGGERDGGRNAEQWDHNPGGQSDGGDDYGLGDSLELAVRDWGPSAKAGGFFVGLGKSFRGQE